MNETLPQPQGDAAYQKLPEVIRNSIPPEGWAWLSDAEKARAIQTETEPEA